MYNSRIAEMFEEIADMLEVEEGDHKFEILAYRKAALTLETVQEDVADIYKRNGIDGLMELQGIGKGLAGKIEEFVTKGKISKYDDMKKKYPIDFKNLTRIQGMGAKKAFKLYQRLKVKNVADLRKAVEQHKVSKLEGFGARSEEEIGKGIALLESTGGRQALGTALPEAEGIVRRLKESGLVERAVIAGSTRRMRETVGDLDILISSKNAEKVMDLVSRLPETESVVQRGPTKTTLRLKIGLNCDIRVVEDSSFGAALQYFTGNKDHNVKVRQIAIKLGYKLNEYGLLDKKGKNVAGPEEESVYRKLGMEMMDPEMREDRGEVELSLQHKIPRVVELSDIKGDLHVHTNHSDGSASIIEMARYAKKTGLQYIGITDHTKSEYVAHGMDDKKFAKHLGEIDRANEQLDGIRILKSAEIDILKDGSLDLADKTLDMMDYRLASIHTSLNMGKEEMTKRVIKAMESGYIDILGHPTDRLINERAPIALDLERVFQAASDNGVVLEIDGTPDRLDLNDENILKAKQYKARFSIDTDSHSMDNLRLMRYGVSMAKRAWVEPASVINTLSIDRLLKEFKK